MKTRRRSGHSQVDETRGQHRGCVSPSNQQRVAHAESQAGVWLGKCDGLLQVLHTSSMACSVPSCSLQWQPRTAGAGMAGHVLGGGSGWQHSRRPLVPPTMLGEHSQTEMLVVQPRPFACYHLSHEEITRGVSYMHVGVNNVSLLWWA